LKLVIEPRRAPLAEDAGGGEGVGAPEGGAGGGGAEVGAFEGGAGGGGAELGGGGGGGEGPLVGGGGGGGAAGDGAIGVELIAVEEGGAGDSDFSSSPFSLIFFLAAFLREALSISTSFFTLLSLFCALMAVLSSSN